MISTTLNINNQLDAVVKIVRDTVGGMLSQMKSTGSTPTAPSVVKKRTTDKTSSNQPSIDLAYPYCLVDFIKSSLWGGAEIVNYKKADNGNAIYESDYIIKLSVEFVGRQTDNVHTIAHRMHSLLKTSEIRNKVNDYTSGNLFRISNDVRKGMIQRQTEWVDLSTIEIEIALRDVIETDSEGNIVQIIVNGELTSEQPDGSIKTIPIQADINGV
jgi:hypothetical protein